MLRINAFGRRLAIERRDGAWVVYDSGSEGKRRRAPDVIIPAELREDELVKFLDDLLHESARPGYAEVVLEPPGD